MAEVVKVEIGQARLLTSPVWSAVKTMVQSDS